MGMSYAGAELLCNTAIFIAVTGAIVIVAVQIIKIFQKKKGGE
jgi:hypothetical protein